MPMRNDEFEYHETLVRVVGKMLGKNIIRADYQTERLHGGTLGDVQLITGTAESEDGKEWPYRVVLKIQKKWERYGDPDSWCREYDLYSSELAKTFSDSFRWPECYHAEISDDETKLWIEYIDGVSGLELTCDMFEQAAEELGQFQGRLYARQPALLKDIRNLSAVECLKNNYLHYRSWKEVYDYIRSDDCEVPKHLCDMLIDMDRDADAIFTRLEKLPIVLCHRDFWVTNIFYSSNRIVLIDWDTTGWGYLGEDIASLIADEADVEHMTEYYQKCVFAYYKGFSKYVDGFDVADHCVHELILIMFGYRLIEWFKFAKTPEAKALQIETLQKIYEMKK